MKKITFPFLITFTMLFLLSCSNANSVASEEPPQVMWDIDGNDSFQFTPDDLTITAETEVDLTFTNVGHLEHNFIVVAPDVDLFAVTEADAINGINSGIVQAGEETSMTFIAPDAGTYTFACVVPGHAAGGMVGTLTVTEGESNDVAGH